MAAPFDLNDDTVVVIIGTGAGGGVLGNELAQKGDPGRRARGRRRPPARGLRQRRVGELRPARLARHAHHLAAAGGSPGTFPTCRPGSSSRSAARRRTSPARACASRTTSGRRSPPTGTSTAPTCSTGRSTSAEMAPWYDKAEAKMGVTRTGDRPGLPGNNNFKVFEAGANKLGYKECQHRPHGDQLCRLRRPHRLPADRLLLPGLQVGREVVDRLHRRAAGDRDRQLELRPAHGAQDRA